jgi:hypothetical protein
MTRSSPQRDQTRRRMVVIQWMMARVERGRRRSGSAGRTARNSRPRPGGARRTAPRRTRGPRRPPARGARAAPAEEQLRHLRLVARVLGEAVRVERGARRGGAAPGPGRLPALPPGCALQPPDPAQGPLPRPSAFVRHRGGGGRGDGGWAGAPRALDPRMTSKYTHLAEGLLGDVVTKAFAAARAAPVLQNGGGGYPRGTETALSQRVAKVGPPGIEPGRRSHGSGF